MSESGEGPQLRGIPHLPLPGPPFPKLAHLCQHSPTCSREGRARAGPPAAEAIAVGSGRTRSKAVCWNRSGGPGLSPLAGKTTASTAFVEKPAGADLEFLLFLLSLLKGLGRRSRRTCSIKDLEGSRKLWKSAERIHKGGCLIT